MPNVCMAWGRVRDLKVHNKAVTFRLAESRKDKNGEDVWTNINCLILSATDWQKSTIQDGRYLGFVGRIEDQKGNDGKVYKNLLVETIKFMNEPRHSTDTNYRAAKKDDDLPF